MYFLPRRIGLACAKQLIFSGRRVDAAEALSIGMVDAVVKHENLIDESLSIADKMTVGSPHALALAKSILDKSLELSIEEVFELGCQAQAICYTTDYHRDAVKSFLEKSK